MNQHRLIQDLPGGSMLAVLLPEAELSGRLPQDVEVAAVNQSKDDCGLWS
jgi:acyl transferase domain-containing protein